MFYFHFRLDPRLDDAIFTAVKQTTHTRGKQNATFTKKNTVGRVFRWPFQNILFRQLSVGGDQMQTIKRLVIDYLFFLDNAFHTYTK